MADVSIIIPVYNKSKYLSTLFEHLKNQVFQEFECILVDDGSTDGSGEIIDFLTQNDGRFKVFHIENQGVSNARNIGLDQSSGKYITFVDADDTIDKNYLSNLYEKIVSTGADIVISGYNKIWEQSKKKIEVTPKKKGLFEFQDVLSDFALLQKQTGIYGWCWAKIFKRELREGLYFNKQLKLAEDFEFYLRLYKKCRTIYFDDKCYYNYLQGAENSSVQADDYLIDYLSQLQINITYKNFLISQAAYYGENRIIVSKLISNYIFFTLYYSTIDSLKPKYDKVCQILEKEDKVFYSENYKQRWIFYNLEKHRFLPIKFWLILIRGLRKVMGRK